MLFQVSIIIPVYNAAKFITNAVESVVHLPQVGEVILVEDKSPDNALIICQQLEGIYDKVKLFRHPNDENRGAGASRNLGISKSNCNYIAFLDADDYYLPNRFETDEILFKAQPDIDGVYNAVGIHFYDEAGKAAFQKIFTNSSDPDFLTTVRRNDLGKAELFQTLIDTQHGYFHTNGITIRKSLFSVAGVFDTTLRLHQDMHLWIRLAYYGSLAAGNINNAVAIRGVHKDNRHTKATKYTKSLFYKELFLWGYRNNIKKDFQKILFMKYLFAYKERYDIKQNKIERGAIFLQNLLELLIKYPKSFLTIV